MPRPGPDNLETLPMPMELLPQGDCQDKMPEAEAVDSILHQKTLQLGETDPVDEAPKPHDDSKVGSRE